jgi:hypothetical protein
MLLREERGMIFADCEMRSGLEVGGRWERIGVEECKLAHELIGRDLDMVRKKEW